jgi:UDP-N-acetylmuramate--alanine ligase
MEATLPTSLVSHHRAACGPQVFTDVSVHMLGVGGSGMSALAEVLLRCGARVSGSDRVASEALRRLHARGARVQVEQDGLRIPLETELCVVSAAIPEDHPELAEAQRRGVPVLKYSEVLGVLMAHRSGIAVSGTHGKSTTTAWLAYALHRGGLDPSFVGGAPCAQLGGASSVGAGPHFVAEACEFGRSFLNLRPRSAVILNIDEDHLDYYADLDAIRGAFAEFAGLLPADGLLLIHNEDEGCRQAAQAARARVETYGTTGDACWQAANLRPIDGRYAFQLVHHGANLGEVHIGPPGRHNVLNALAVAALAHNAGVGCETIRQALTDFGGVQRRLELRSELGGIRVADDYAHHPTEIRATLLAARERFAPRHLWCVFQPHQHSRTRLLLDEFARSFGCADHLIVSDIYAVRDSASERQSIRAADLAERVCQSGADAVHISDFEHIVGFLLECVVPGDLVLTMGAGDIWKVADELVRRLPERQPG